MPMLRKAERKLEEQELNRCEGFSNSEIIREVKKTLLFRKCSFPHRPKSWFLAHAVQYPKTASLTLSPYRPRVKGWCWQQRGGQGTLQTHYLNYLAT